MDRISDGGRPHRRFDAQHLTCEAYEQHTCCRTIKSFKPVFSQIDCAVILGNDSFSFRVDLSWTRGFFRNRRDG